MNEENNNDILNSKNIYRTELIVTSIIIIITVLFVILKNVLDYNRNNNNNKTNNHNVVEEKEQNTTPKIVPGCKEVNLNDSKFKYDKYIVEEFPDIFLSDNETDKVLGHIKTISKDAEIRYKDSYNNNFIIEDDDNYYLYNYDSKKYYDLKLNGISVIPEYLTSSGYQGLIGFTSVGDSKFYSLAACDFLYEGEDFDSANDNENIYVAFNKRDDNKIYIGRYDKKEIIHTETIDTTYSFIYVPKIEILSNNFVYIGYTLRDYDGKENRTFIITDRKYNHLIEGYSEHRPEYYAFSNKLYIMDKGDFYYFDSDGNKSNVINNAEVVGILDNYFVLYKDDNFELYKGVDKLATLDTEVSIKAEGMMDKYSYQMYDIIDNKIRFNIYYHDENNRSIEIIYLIDMKNNYKVEKMAG